MKIDWKKKLSSRKFWLALVGVASGVFAAIYDNPTEGAILIGSSVLGYLAAEGYIDGKAAAAVAAGMAEALNKSDSEEIEVGGTDD